MHNLKFLATSINFEDFNFNLSMIRLRGLNVYVNVFCNELRRNELSELFGFLDCEI